MNGENNSYFCKNCGADIAANSNKCSQCGRRQYVPIWVILLGILALIVGTVMVTSKIYTSKDNKSSANPYNKYNKPSNNSSSNSNNIIKDGKKKNVYGFDETFIFDDLKITIGKNYEFAYVNNRFSDYNGMPAVKLPITVENLSDETHGLNMFFYDVYGSKGTEVESLGSYFDDDIDYAGDLRSGASYTRYMYFLYDGDGLYAIEFDDWSTKVTVEFNIDFKI